MNVTRMGASGDQQPQPYHCKRRILKSLYIIKMYEVSKANDGCAGKMKEMGQCRTEQNRIEYLVYDITPLPAALRMSAKTFIFAPWIHSWQALFFPPHLHLKIKINMGHGAESYAKKVFWVPPPSHKLHRWCWVSFSPIGIGFSYCEMQVST